MDIKSKVAVITGAGSGIGAGIAEAMVDAGASVVVADVEIDKAQSVADRLVAKGGRAVAYGCDVRDLAAVEGLADFAWETYGQVDILCNNAGISVQGPVLDKTPADLKWIFEVNVFGVWNGIHVFGPRFLAAGTPAWVVNTGSHHSIGAPTKGVATYVATKHAVLGLTEACRTELGDRIGFSVLCPGIIATELWDAARNRPVEFGGAETSDPATGELVRALGFPPRDVGQLVVNGIVAEDFWIWTHPQDIELIEKRYRESAESIKRQWPNGPTEKHKQTPSHVE